MKFIVFILVLLIMGAEGFAAESCRASQPLNEANMRNPLAINAWLRTVGSKVKSVKDFVCCLPQEYRSNFMIGHSSIAGQNGTPASPRIIMMNKVDGAEKEPLHMMLSFNGGEDSMSGNKSIEIAYINPRNKETEYFDLSFDEIKGKHLSNKNPESCMNCHGDHGKTPAGGAKMIFDIFGDWHRFVGGVGFPCNKEEDQLRRVVEAQAVESVMSNSQYECLDRNLIRKNDKGEYVDPSGALGSLDNSMSGGISERQRKAWAQSVPELDKYQYFMAGYSLCGGAITEWMSPDIYRRNFANLEIDPRLKKDGPLEKVFLEALMDEDNKVIEFRNKQKTLIANKNAGKKIMEINRSSRACLEAKGLDTNEEMAIQALKQDHSKYFSQRDPLVLLELDNYLRGPRLQSRSLPGPVVRFALEGKGIGTYMLQKSFRPGELVHGGLVPDERNMSAPARELKALLAKDPVLNPIFLKYPEYAAKLPKPSPASKEKFNNLCFEMKGLSRTALGDGPKINGAKKLGTK